MKYNPNSFLFVLFASVLFLVFSAQPAQALSLEVPELKARFEALHQELVDFSEHSSLIKLVKRRGGSSGKGSSSSSSSSSSGRSSSSSSSSSGSSRAGTAGTYTSSSGRYTGGSVTPVLAGAATGLGLASLLILASSANTHYPGHWGTGVYSYHYNTTLNDTNYDVTCYCIQYNPCTCEKVEDKSYFDNLPQNISKTSVRDNVTYVYINGTADNTTSTATSSAASSATSASSGAVSSLYNNMGSGFLLALSIATLSFLI
ncbi:hypothetical protein D0Z00_000798 [Geotrichum galactomycetum]|uniref:Uncharacterized protein n=1 Tax=Geotrichum galactomycetum TaxID=27317 RepID=A0ACB6V920_9ASCO|nr:hypothetical protein D0Z00_000798 [Geotrichum candidum]